MRGPLPRLVAEAVPAFRTTDPGTPVLEVLDYHTAGEPFRIVTGGMPAVAGGNILARRRTMREHHDHVRRLLMWEPRGHADMYGGVLVPPDHDEARVGVLFMHNEGYSTMCGHGTIALATALVESGAVPATGTDTPIGIDAPCGLLRTSVRVRPADLDEARTEGGTPRVHEVVFRNVPAFAAALDVPLEVPEFGTVTCDIGYGGAFYAVLPAERLGLVLATPSTPELVRAARAVTDAARARLSAGGADAERWNVRHPLEPDLSFLYGTILTGPAEDPGHSDRNVCVFAEGELDRSPTGSGLSARLALKHARGELRIGEEMTVESVLGRASTFSGRILGTLAWAGREAVIPEIRGRAHAVGSARFVLSPEDSLGRGFLLPR